jgi:hypothetical protein
MAMQVATCSLHLPPVGETQPSELREQARVSLIANGLTAAQVLEELPDLERDDIQACLRFASQRLNHPVVVA